MNRKIPFKIVEAPDIPVDKWETLTPAEEAEVLENFGFIHPINEERPAASARMLRWNR